MKTYGNDVFSYSPFGRQYVTRWNDQSPLASALMSNSPLSSGTAESPISGTRSTGSNASGDGPQSEMGANPPGQVGEGFQVASLPSAGMTFSDFAPTRGGIAATGGSILGSALAGPIGGALGGFAAGQTAGQGIGRGAGSAIGGLLGSALGPVGTIAGSALGGWLGGQSDGPSMGDFQTVSDDGSARAAALGNLASTEGGGYGGGGSPGSSVGSDVGQGSGEVSGEGAPGGYYKGGHVTRDRLTGPNPPGPDDGYAALDEREFVIRQKAADKIGPDMLARLNSGKFNREALARALMGKGK
jgi:hypothetical protein